MTEPNDRAAYFKFRSDLVGEIERSRLTPNQVADRLLAAKSRFPQIDALEILNLRQARDWAEAHRRIVGRRFANTRDDSDLIWLDPEHVARRDSDAGRLRLAQCGEVPYSPLMPGEAEPEF